MKHALILAHPNPESFVAALARHYGEALTGLGHEVIWRDLYRMGFDPVLKAEEIPSPQGVRPGADVLAERALLGTCDVYTLVFPMWLQAMPGILKGYLDRVFGYGFAFETGAEGPKPKLGGKRLVILSASGAPTDWLVQTGAWEAIRILQDTYLAELAGLTFVEHVHCGYVVPNMTKAAAEAHFARARAAAARHFSVT